jgi:hypothetical protein
VPLEDRPVNELNAAELRELLERERVRIRCTKLTLILLTGMQNKRAQDVKKEPVSIKKETDQEIKPKAEAETETKSETEPTPKSKRELHIDEDGVEFVEVREVCKRMKHTRIDEGKVVELE